MAIAAPLAYASALAVVLWEHGIPAARERLLLWIVLGLLAFSVTRVRGWARGVLVEWLPFALVLWAYDLLRGRADGLLFDAYVRPQLEADRLLFGDVPSVWLQERLWHGPGDVRWYDYAAWGVYVSYFVAPYVLAGALWFFDRARFRRYVGTFALLAFMGFATFALFPAAPPWLASESGALEPTTRAMWVVAGEVPVLDFAALFERGGDYANPVAAVPSLHGAYTLLFTIFVWRYDRRARPLLALYPFAMTFALAYGAEHYVIDVLAGFAYTLLALLLVHTAAERITAARAARTRPS
ncbi:MAG TPA: phosphatase PAP2 family protein [Gaiellaceae bacterium]|nr:phosphatase PAP2 family protein [Gaiellaceae bacterium]